MRLFCLLLIITSPLFGVGSCSRLLPALDGCTYVGSANGDVWKSSVVARDMSAPITLASDEAASTDISQGGFDGVRGEVIVSKRQNRRIVAFTQNDSRRDEPG